VRTVWKEVHQTSGGGAALSAVATIMGVGCVMAEFEGSQIPPMPNLEVSWQLTCVRNDKYARENPFNVERNK